MIRLAVLAVFVALVASAPTSKESSEANNETLIINDDFFPDELKIHTAEHEIIHILYPLNSLNFDDDAEDKSTEGKDEKIIFFVEADLSKGIEYKGLSVIKNNQTTKILPTGTCSAADLDDSKTAYFGATDGLYKYNEIENNAVKYGPITDSIIDIAKANGSDIIYILTDKNELFRVTEDGTKKEQITDVVGAKQIVLDTSNNLYYYAEDKKPYVFSAGSVKKIEGLPSNPDYIKLLRPAFVIDDGASFIVDKNVYTIYVNGSSEAVDIEINTKPSAYAIEATLIQYYAYNKSIYEYNIVMLLLTDLVDLKNFLNDKTEQISELATRSRSDFNALTYNMV